MDLARLDGADRQHVRRSICDLLVGGDIGQGRDALGDSVHPVGAHAEQFGHLRGHELRRRVHDGTAVEGPADEGFVGKRVDVGELGEPHRREVVDGDDLSGLARRRYDEVGAVHHVDLACPPLDRRLVPAHPRPAQRPRRHRAPGRSYTSRHHLPDLGPAPPRDRVRDRFDVGPGGHCMQHAQGEHADAGAGPEQRRGVEGDADGGGVVETRGQPALRGSHQARFPRYHSTLAASASSRSCFGRQPRASTLSVAME